MKYFFFLFYSIIVFSQQQFRTTDFGYSSDVKKVEESLYKFNKYENKFVLESISVTDVQDTYFQKQIIESYVEQNKLVAEYNYFYNPDSTLKEINYKPSTNQFAFPLQFIFKYANSKLEKMQIQGISNTFYFYDSKGNLEKEIQKDIQNELVKTTVYKRNVANDTYEKVIQEGDGSTGDFTKEYYEKGLKIKSETKNEDTTFSVEYSYDSNRNISKQTYDDGSTIEYGYEYDKKNNPTKIAKFSAAFPDENSFTFIKITFQDGTVSGSNLIDNDFVKKYDLNWRMRDSLLTAYKKIKYSHKNNLSVLKGENNEIEIQDSYDNNYEKVVLLNPSPNHTGLLIFNEINKKVYFVKDFYFEDFPKHEWQDALQVESPTSIYWILDKKNLISFYQNGVYLDSSRFTIEEDRNPSDLLVKTTAGEVFIMKNINQSQANVLYPLLKK